MRRFTLGIGCLVALALVTPSMARDWHPANSGLVISADLDGFDGKTVWLRVPRGAAVFALPIEKLSTEDQEYLKKTYPNGKERETKPEESPAKKDAGNPQPESAEAKKPGSADAKAKKSPAGPRVARRVATRARNAKTGDFDVEMVSLTITKPPKNAEAGNGNALAGLTPGTHATLLVSSRSKTLLRVDLEKTKIACADDKATNLSQPLPGSEAAAAGGGLNLQVAPDGKSGTIVFDFPQPPTAEATRIRLKGDLHLVCGSEDNPETVKVPLTLIVSLGL